MKTFWCVLFCLLNAVSAAQAVGNCAGDLWPADIDGDCVVTYEDYSLMAANWGVTWVQDPPFPNPAAEYGPPYGGTTIFVDFTPVNPADITLSGDWRVGMAESWKTYVAQREPNDSVTTTPGQGEFWKYTGTGSVTINYSLPAGDYFVHAWWAPGSWANGANFEFKFSGTGVTEHGANNPNEFHTIWPTTTSFEPVLKTEFIGPTMLAQPSALIHFDAADPSDLNLHVGTSQWQGSTNYPGTYLTLDAGNQVVLTVNENDNLGNYGRLLFYGIYFIPAIVPPPPGPQPITIQAEDCVVTETSAGTDPDSEAIVLSDVVRVMGHPDIEENNVGRGTARLTIAQAIPDGEYEVLVGLKTGALTNPGNGGFWTVKLGSTTGTITENGGGDGTGDARFYNPFNNTPGLQENFGYESWFASATGSAGWYAPIWEAGPGGPLPSSVTLSGIAANDLFFEFQDGMPENSTFTDFDFFQFVPIPDLEGDIDNSNTVDMDDLMTFGLQWLNCNDADDPTCTDIICNPKPAIGITDYTAYDVTTTSPVGAVTIDGDLSDWPALDETENDPLWCGGKWVELDLTNFGTNNFVEDVFMCLMYDATTDLVYGAVVAHDFDPKYGWSAWNDQDSIEVYIQGDISTRGDPNFVDPYNDWAFGQQFMVGVDPTDPNSDIAFTLWPDGTDFSSGPDPGLTAVARHIVNGPFDDNLIYEFVLVPYDNYGGYDLSPTTQTDLTPGKQFGFDVIVSNSSPFSASFGMRAANLQTGKANDVNAYGTATCE